MTLDHLGKTDTELTTLEAELADKPKLSVDELVAGVNETLRSLDLTDKKLIIKKIITKIVATQKEATIWGRIPILATEHVGLYASNRYAELINLPFEISFTLPKPDDKRTRGYSPNFVNKLQTN